ncbi:hypothetical protein WJ968_29870 [Achromobacter xylosoxidans]
MTTRPVRGLSGEECEAARVIYPGCGRYKRTDLQRGFNASYFRRIAALERGKACF